MRLTVQQVQRLGPGRHCDGKSLYLYVKPSGKRYWVFRYRDRLTQKLKDMGLGPYPDVKLAEARLLAEGHRATLREGKDPLEVKAQARIQSLLERSSSKTFLECSTMYIESQKAGWSNSRHANQWSATIQTHCQNLHDLPVSLINVNHVVQTLEPIWTTKNETANRIRGRIERILDWATVSQLRQGPNPAQWRGNLSHLLPSPAKVKKVKHMQALPYRQIPMVVSNLAQRTELSSAALLLVVLTATRATETLGAKWSEFDLDASLWTIPADRMKARKEHIVPLSKRAKELLITLKEHRSSEFVFPSPRTATHITSAATLKMCRIVTEVSNLTTHGFRSSFRDWAAEQTSHPKDVIEMALAHRVLSKTEAAYHRSNLLQKRALLMDDWDAFCYSLIPTT